MDVEAFECIAMKKPKPEILCHGLPPQGEVVLRACFETIRGVQVSATAVASYLPTEGAGNEYRE